MLLVLVVCLGVGLFLALAYWAASGWAYRRPWALLLLGVVAAGSAVHFRWIVNSWRAAASSPWTTDHLDLAISVLDPTLVGLSGGIIGSAIFLRAQSRHLAEEKEARLLLDNANEVLVEVYRLHEKFRDDAPTMSDIQFRTALAQINRLLEKSISFQEKAKRLATEFGVIKWEKLSGRSPSE